MDRITLVILLISLYGAILSTILAGREIGSSRKKIGIFLDRWDRDKRNQITIINMGHRSAKLIDLAIDVAFGPIPPAEMTPDKWPFPITLHDGDSLTINLSQLATTTIGSDEKRMTITVFDADGNRYTRFAVRKFGGKPADTVS